MAKLKKENGKQTAKKVAPKTAQGKLNDSKKVFLNGVAIQYTSNGNDYNKKCFMNSNGVANCDNLLANYIAVVKARGGKNLAKYMQLVNDLAILEKASTSAKKNIYAPATLDNTANKLAYDRSKKEYIESHIVVFVGAWVKSVQNHCKKLANDLQGRPTITADLVR